MKKIYIILLIFCSFVMKVRSQSCNFLCNGDFENPVIGHWTQIPDTVFQCWKTTESDSLIEVWWTGFNGVPAYHGNQFVELNANAVGTLFQNFLIAPTTTITIGFAHRGRAGVDTMSVSIGPVGGPYVTLGKYADGNVNWGYYTVNYVIPSNLGSYYSLRFNSIYAAGGIPTVGNFLDDISVNIYPQLGTTKTVNNVPCLNGNNGSATITVTTGSAPYTYMWAPVTGTTNTLTGLSAGMYTCLITDANGCSTIDTITISQPTSVLTANITMTQATCGGKNGTATVTAAGGTSPYTYAWNPSGETTAMATGLSPGIYSVTVEDKGGCSVTSSVTVTNTGIGINVAIASTTDIICFGGNTGSVTCAASGGITPYTYSWNPSGQTNQTATGLIAGVYTITVEDSSGCSNTAEATITQAASIDVVINGPQVICQGSTDTLIANVTNGVAPYTYTWSSGITSTTSRAIITPFVSQTYSVTVTDADGCSGTSSISVSLEPPLAISINGATTVCNGSQATLCAVVNRGSGTSFLWQPGNFTTPCITVSPSATTTYTLTVIDICGEIETATATIQVNAFPVVNFMADLYEGCTPLCIQFYNTTIPPQGGILSYVWKFGNGDTLQSESPAYCYPASGVYSVSLTITTPDGCSSTLEKVNLITVFSSPKAAFTFSPQPTDILSPTIQFTDMSSDVYGLAYWYWNFNDINNSTSQLRNPSHTYQDTGTYCAQLAVMDNHGCTDTATNCVVIDPAYSLYIPSAFSPNGDGLNEMFQAKGQYIKSFEMYIFDRWGTQLFHSANIAYGWNGTVGGPTIAQEDTYVYKIMVTDTRNNQHSYIGNVTLIK
jgi:gliding motility-associated-like protein